MTIVKVEILNGVLDKGLFKAYKCKDHSRWPEYLAEALFLVRVNKSTVTKWFLFELLYRVSPRLIGDSAILRAPNLASEPSSQKARLERLQEARKVASDAKKRRSETKVPFGKNQII